MRKLIRDERLWLVVLTVIGGVAVLGSYAHGLMTNPETRGQLWGGVPEYMLPYYTANMLLAAAGFFAFTSYLVFAVPVSAVRVRSFGYRLFLGLYFLILIPSALWMPLTFSMLDSPSTAMWLMVRVDLAVVGSASVALLLALITMSPTQPRAWHTAAVIGAVPFAIQTAVLDALIWPAYFPLAN